MKSVAEIVNNSQVYKQKLHSDDWRKFARSMRQTKGGVCNSCGLGDRPTQLHHLFYDPHREPWEYTQEEFVLLCDVCHKEIHEQLKSFRKHVFAKLTPQSFRVLNGALAVGLDMHDPLIFCHALAEFASNPRLVENYAKSFDCPSFQEVQ